MATMDKKNASKTETALIENPTIRQSEYDCVDVSINSKGDAYIVSLSLFAGSPEEISFKPEGEKNSVTYSEMGGINLDDVFDVGGTKCKFRVIKGKEGKSDRLVIRPVSETTKSGKAKPSF